MNEPSTIWSSILDERYDVRVIRGETLYWGTLIVRDLHTDTVLLSESTTLSYAAAFGPDAEDVMRWQDRVVAVIDGREPGSE